MRLFVMGKANYWRDEPEWPLSRARTVKYYLRSGGKANTLFGDGVLSTEPPGGSKQEVEDDVMEDRLSLERDSDTFIYDPNQPVPTVGGAIMGAGENDIVIFN